MLEKDDKQLKPVSGLLKSESDLIDQHEREELEELKRSADLLVKQWEREAARRATNRNPVANALRLKHANALVRITETCKTVNRIEAERQALCSDYNKTAQLSDIAESHAHLFTRFCSKTGAELGPIDIGQTLNLISIHGKERAQSYLEQTALSHISPEWLYTDGPALKQLQTHQPVSFLIYTASQLFHSQAITSTGEMSKPLDDLTSGKSGKPVTIMPEKDAHLKYPSFETRKAQLEEKITARQQLDKFRHAVIIDETNELMRRVFSLIDPGQLYRIRELQEFNLLSITSSPIALFAFCEELKNVLRAFTKKQIDSRIKKTNAKFVKRSDILQLASEHKGRSAFRNQKSKPQRFLDPDIADMLSDFLTFDVMNAEKLDPDALVKSIPMEPVEKVHVPSNGNLKFGSSAKDGKKPLSALLKRK